MKNKGLKIGLWFLGMIVAHLLLFIAADEQTSAVWVTYGFTLLMFLSQLILWLTVGKKPLDSSQKFTLTPLFTYSGIGLFGQLILCLTVIFFAMSAKAAILCNALFAVAIWGLLLVSLLSRSHVEDIDQRQKDHHKVIEN